VRSGFELSVTSKPFARTEAIRRCPDDMKFCRTLTDFWRSVDQIRKYTNSTVAP